MACHLTGQAVLALTPVPPFSPSHTALDRNLQVSPGTTSAWLACILA